MRLGQRMHLFSSAFSHRHASANIALLLRTVVHFGYIYIQLSPGSHAAKSCQRTQFLV